MKKKLLIFSIACTLSLSLIACGKPTSEMSQNDESQTSASETKKPLDLSGTWQSDENEGSYQEAIIGDDTIEINWISDGGDTQAIYWIGTFDAPTEFTEEYSWISARDKEKTDTALMASTDDSKEFTYKDGIISYKTSAFGVTTTMKLTKTSNNTVVKRSESETITETQPESETQKETIAETEASKSVPTEYLNALEQAQDYSDLMHMSKKGIYDQLTSEYGGQFAEDAAQYAVDNIDADWKANALATAENYSETMHMSKQGIYEQLVSEYGEQFAEKEAQYAIDNIKADWKANALETAKNYQENMNMSIEAIRDQLTSEYGEQFTAEEADYAVSHLK